jgi:quinol monooxygenase YgiN
MSRSGLSGTMKARPGQRDALLEELLEAADLVADVPGCEVWIVNTIPERPGCHLGYRSLRSEADYAASVANDVVKTVIAHARPLIAGFGERFRLEPEAGKGLTAP